MKCMRCGRDLKEDSHVFCHACREYMDTCPVSPGTPIQLPQQVEAAANRKKVSKKKKEVKPEEQIAALRKLAAWMALVILVLVVAVAVLTGAMLHFRKLAQPAEQPLAAAEIVSRETIFDNI